MPAHWGNADIEALDGLGIEYTGIDATQSSPDIEARCRDPVPSGKQAKPRRGPRSEVFPETPGNRLRAVL